MAPRGQAPKPKTRISHIIIKAIRDRAPNDAFNDELAKTLNLTREQVRNSMRQVMRDHPEYGIQETMPYYYVYDPTSVPHPISAVPAPHIPTYEELGGTPTAEPTLAMRVHAASVAAVTGTSICEFTVVTRRGDVVILADEHSALWAAKKL